MVKAEPYTPPITISNHTYFPPPYSSPHLPIVLHRGLFPLGILALLSVTSTLAVITFIISRSIRLRIASSRSTGNYQYVVLVLNLLIADVQQSSSFLMSWYWIGQQRILAPSPACFAQGWLLHSGDVGSGFFVLSIALHTFYTAVFGRKIGKRTFAGIIGLIWTVTYLLTAVGVGIKRKEYFVLAGAWCWVSPAFQEYRLWCHYSWIFIIQFSTILIYIATFLLLRRKTRKVYFGGRLPANSPNAATVKAVERITILMTLYPCVYVLLTLPLSAGRMWSYARGGQPTSLTFSIIAGCLLTSCGWVDSLMYTLTRKRLMRQPTDEDDMSKNRHKKGKKPGLKAIVWRKGGPQPGAQQPVQQLSSGLSTITPAPPQPLPPPKRITHTVTFLVEADNRSTFELNHPGSSLNLAYYDIETADHAHDCSGIVDPMAFGRPRRQHHNRFDDQESDEVTGVSTRSTASVEDGSGSNERRSSIWSMRVDAV